MTTDESSGFFKRTIFAGIEFEIVPVTLNASTSGYKVDYAVVMDEGTSFVDLYTFSKYYSVDSEEKKLLKIEFSSYCLGEERCILVSTAFLRQIKTTIIEWIQQWMNENTDTKLIAIGLCKQCAPSAEFQADFCSDMWLKLDIIPSIFETHGECLEDRAQSGLKKALSLFGRHCSPKIDINPFNRVLVDAAHSIFLASLLEYSAIFSSPEILANSQSLINRLRNQRIVFISSTPQGGGVALMRHGLLRFFHLLGLSFIHWYVMKPSQKAFIVTKTKIHNVLQGVTSEMITDEDCKVYNSWIDKNATDYWKNEVFSKANLVILDDPQVAGLCPVIKATNSTCKIIYRSHIHVRADLVDAEGTPQNLVWKKLCFILKGIDRFVSHPIADFIPKLMPLSREKIVYMPPCTDPLDGLNKHLDSSEIDYYLGLFQKICLEQQNYKQSLFEIRRPYMIQIARFDPSKGIDELIESYKKTLILLKTRMKDENLYIPNLVICGNGAIDDPDGNKIFENTIQLLLRPENDEIRENVYVARLPHYDQILNALLRRAKVCFQLSYSEGFEIKVTEALMKGVPTIVYNSGGLPLQIQHEKNGYVIPVHETDTVAESCYKLLSDKTFYKFMSDNAKASYRQDCLVQNHAFNVLKLFEEVIFE